MFGRTLAVAMVCAMLLAPLTGCIADDGTRADEPIENTSAEDQGPANATNGTDIGRANGTDASTDGDSSDRVNESAEAAEDAADRLGPVPDPFEARIVDVDDVPLIGVSWNPPGDVLSDGAFEIPRSPLWIHPDTQRLQVRIDVTDTTTGFQVGYTIDDGPITWLPQATEDTTITVQVAPNQTEQEERRWTFYGRLSSAQDEDTGASVLTGNHGWTLEIDAEVVPDDPRPLVDPDAPPREQWRTYTQVARYGIELDPPNTAAVGSPGDRSVVAVLDSGVNAMHERFARPELSQPGSLPVEAADATNGQAPDWIPVDVTGVFTELVIEPGKLYRLGGTNLLYYSLFEEPQPLDYFGHGTWTTGTVTQTAPDTIVVAVQIEWGTIDEGLSWAAQQPWIDVVSVSFGCPANVLSCPVPSNLDPADVDQHRAEIAEAARDVWQAGKLVVGSAGNEPTPIFTDESDAPPWVISVGGWDRDGGGERSTAAKAPELVADYTVEVPDDDAPNGTDTVSGTSFSAPTVAGTIAGALTEVRNRMPGPSNPDGPLLAKGGPLSVTNEDVRRVLNRTAVYRGEDAYDPTSGPGEAAPVPSAAPWLQTGWGYVDGRLASQMADGLIAGTEPKPEPARTYMQHHVELRQALWS